MFGRIEDINAVSANTDTKKAVAISAENSSESAAKQLKKEFQSASLTPDDNFIKTEIATPSKIQEAAQKVGYKATEHPSTFLDEKTNSLQMWSHKEQKFIEIEGETINKDGIATGTTNFNSIYMRQYNENAQKVIESYLTPNGQIISTTIFTYDEKGNRTDNILQPNGNVEIIKNNSELNTKICAVIDKYGKIFELDEIKYGKEKSFQWEDQTIILQDVEKHISYKRDAEGNWSSITTEDINGKKIKTKQDSENLIPSDKTRRPLQNFTKAEKPDVEAESEDYEVF